VKRWIGRFLWIAAWCGWAWLGVGLHRELPRRPGDVVCVPEVAKDATPVGFVGKTGLLVLSRIADPVTRITEIAVVDAKDGRKVHAVRGPFDNDQEFQQNIVQSLASGVLLSSEMPHENGRNFTPSLRALDLAAGEWRLLDDQPVRHVTMHPQKPWVAYVRTVLNYDHSLRVADVTTGKRLLNHRLPTRAKVLDRPFFLEGDRVAVVGSSSEGVNAKDAGGRYEILSMNTPDAKPTVVEGPAVDQFASMGMNGRVVYKTTSHSPAVEVFDLETRQSKRPLSAQTWGGDSDSISPPVISCSGRTVLGGAAKSVWNIDTEMEIWRPGSWESPHAFDYYDDFAVVEDWSGLWAKFLPGFRFKTWARRDFATGALKQRTSYDQNVIPHFCNAAGNLAAMKDGTIRSLPLRVNWPLLALCQAVLAAPLVLLWAVLRWRRRRKEPFQRGLEA
jgi:hypothetical protein